MNPPLILKDGAVWAVCGTPGADNQVQINFQIITAMIDFGLDPQQAAEMPRWTSNVPANTPTTAFRARRVDDGAPLPEAVRADLARRGHPVDTSAISKGRAVSRSSAARRTACFSPVPIRAVTAGL